MHVITRSIEATDCARSISAIGWNGRQFCVHVVACTHSPWDERSADAKHASAAPPPSMQLLCTSQLLL
jgi:hypothetical protein